MFIGQKKTWAWIAFLQNKLGIKFVTKATILIRFLGENAVTSSIGTPVHNLIQSNPAAMG